MIKFCCDKCGNAVSREDVVALKIVRNAFMPGITASYVQVEICPRCADLIQKLVGAKGSHV